MRSRSFSIRRWNDCLKGKPVLDVPQYLNKINRTKTQNQNVGRKIRSDMGKDEKAYQSAQISAGNDGKRVTKSTACSITNKQERKKDDAQQEEK